MSSDGELMMTILASYAQEESRSASENQKWRIRRGFERGELVNLRFLFGYKIEKGRVAVDPEKAAVVQEVFRRALEGESLTSLAIDLNRRGFTGVLGGKWNSMRIREMLSNEKYLGNALLQKQYRNNHLEKKEIPNRGELPQYYAEGTHEAIIDQATFDAAQELLTGITENSPVKRAPPAVGLYQHDYLHGVRSQLQAMYRRKATFLELPNCGADRSAFLRHIPDSGEAALRPCRPGARPCPVLRRASFWKESGASMPSRTRPWCSISKTAPRQSGIGNTYQGQELDAGNKEIARQRALAQRRGEKWQEP